MSDIRKILEARLNSPPKSPLEATRKFLRAYFSDALDIKEVRNQMAQTHANFPSAFATDLLAIESVIANPPSKTGTLAEMVAWDANWVLDDPSDQGAKAFLREVAEMIREVRGEK